jgi:hypothetical protein
MHFADLPNGPRYAARRAFEEAGCEVAGYHRGLDLYLPYPVPEQALADLAAEHGLVRHVGRGDSLWPDTVGSGPEMRHPGYFGIAEPCALRLRTYVPIPQGA